MTHNPFRQYLLPLASRIRGACLCLRSCNLECNPEAVWFFWPSRGMSRLLSLSPLVFCPRCEHSARSSAPVSSCSAARGKLHTQLLCGRAAQCRGLSLTRRIFRSNHGGKWRVWALGIGTGLLLALGLKSHLYSGERCECETTETGDRYSAAIDTSRDLLQRIKVQYSTVRYSTVQ